MDSVLGLVRHGGNEGLFQAIEMSLLAAAVGQPLHLHAEGLRGTGKTTIMRAARRVLPKIRRIKGCLYNCDPAHPHCPQHRPLTPSEISAIGDEWIAMPFREISHSAKVGTVVGSIDLARLVNPAQPEAALLPGTIVQAHRGIVFVDEINRLAETAPELADILLDVMGTKPGRIQIEETGLPPVELPIQVTVWAASNPDEDPGPLEEIRRQLSDRFDFAVFTDRPTDVAVVAEILARADAGGRDRILPALAEAKADAYKAKLSGKAALLPATQVAAALRQQVAEIYSRYGVESLRAVQALHLGLRLSACLQGRKDPVMEDLAAIAPMALRHRVDPDAMKKVTAYLAGLQPKAEPEPAPAPALAKHRFGSLSFGGAVLQPPAEAGTGWTGQPPFGNRSEPATETGPVRSEPGTGATGQSAGLRSAVPEPPVSRSGLDSGLPRGSAEPPVQPMRSWDRTSPEPAPVKPGGWLSRALFGLRRNLGLNGTEPLNRRGAPGSAGPSGNAGAAGHGRSGFSGMGAGVPGGGQQGRQTAGSPQLVDPLKVPPLAPPHAARSVTGLYPNELIRSEEELRRLW